MGARNPDLEFERAGQGGGRGGFSRYSDHDDRTEGPPEPRKRESSPGGSWAHDLFDVGVKVAPPAAARVKEERGDRYDPLAAPEKAAEKESSKEEVKEKEEQKPSDDAPAKKDKSRSRGKDRSRSRGKDRSKSKEKAPAAKDRSRSRRRSDSDSESN